MRSFCLEMHAPWRCRHSGACCTAGWAIPIEGPAFERVTLHFRNCREGRFISTGGPPPEGAAGMVETSANGQCVFYDTNGDRLCAIHRELGPGSLPVACRQFPRQVLEDGRGVFITLSHYCPTAAGLIIDNPSPAIVQAPPNLDLDGELEGLDATEVLPPLLKPDLLTDLAGYDAWERESLEALATRPGSADEVLNAIASATRRIGDWRPSNGSLAAFVTDVFHEQHGACNRADPGEDRQRFQLALASIPRGLDRPDVPAAGEANWRNAVGFLDDHDRIVRAYLAAKLFGNWVAYHGRGLRTIVEYLRVCLAVLRMETLRQRTLAPRHSGTLHSRQQLIESIRAADLLMSHLADLRALARLIDTPRR